MKVNKDRESGIQYEYNMIMVRFSLIQKLRL